MCSKTFLKTIYYLVFILNLGYVTSQSLKYGGIHDSHFEYIQTTETSLFPGRFRKKKLASKLMAY